MSDYFRMIKDGEKQPQVTPDKIDWEVLAKSKRDYEKHLQEREHEEKKTGK